MQWRARWSCAACPVREGHVQACLLCSPSPNQLCSNQDCFRSWSDGGSEWKGKIAIPLQILFASVDSIWDTSCLTSGVAGEGNCSVWLLTVTDPRASTFFFFFFPQEKFELYWNSVINLSSVRIHSLNYSCFSNTNPSQSPGCLFKVQMSRPTSRHSLWEDASLTN